MNRKHTITFFLLIACCLLTAVFNIVQAQHALEAKDSIPLIDSLLKTATAKQVREVIIAGNKRTKIYIVQRELAFKTGTTYDAKTLLEKIRLSKEQLINTTLFVSVEIVPVNIDSNQLDLQVNVKERWYLFPFPYFKTIDRNWNEWLNTYNASFSRVNYGVKISENNLTGRNDKLYVWLINGYTRQVSFRYTQPYIDKKLKQGAFFGLQHARTREVNFASSHDTLRFYKLPGFARSFTTAYAGYTYRQGSKERHSLRLAYTTDKLDTAIINRNPDFFGAGLRRQQFADLTYNFQYFNVDYIIYPLRGWYADVYAGKRFSQNLNQWTLGGKFLQSWQVGKGNYFMFQGIGSIKLPFTQPYYNSHLLGYGDLTMRGMEYLVVDGVAGGIIKGTVRKKLLAFSVKNFVGIKNIQRIPFSIYGKIYGDMGYVYSRNESNNSRLANKLLRTAGVGVDIVTIYDLVLKIEFSLNQLGGRGVYYHAGSDF